MPEAQGVPQEHSARAALEQLYTVVYQELRSAARHQLGREAFASIQPTELVHEVYLRLLRGDLGTLSADRSYFFGAATRAMRRILVERARQAHTQKRGGRRDRVTLAGVEADGSDAAWASMEDVLAVDEILRELKTIDPKMARLIELRFFGGLTVAEAAVVLSTTERSVYRLWRAARAYLHTRLGEARGTTLPQSARGTAHPTPEAR